MQLEKRYEVEELRKFFRINPLRKAVNLRF